MYKFKPINSLTSLDTFPLVKALFSLSKFLGLAPFVMVNTSDGCALRVSRGAVIYSTGMLILISAFLIDRISFRKDFHMSSWPVSVANTVFQLSTTLFTYWASYISCITNCSNMAKVLKQIFTSVFSQNVLLLKYKLFNFILAFQIFGGFITFGVLYYIEWCHDLYPDYSEMIPYIVIDCCDYVYVLQLIDLVLLLGHYFDVLGSRIHKLCKDDEDLISVKRNTIVSLSHYGISYEKTSKISSRVKIQELSCLYNSLCDTSELVNSIYSFMILVNSAGALVGITYGLYIASITIFDRINAHDRELNPLLPTLSWSAFYVTMLVCVVTSCSSTCRKVSELLAVAITAVAKLHASTPQRNRSPLKHEEKNPGQ